MKKHCIISRQYVSWVLLTKPLRKYIHSARLNISDRSTTYIDMSDIS